MAELYAWPGILTTLLEDRDLSVSESTWAMRQIMSGSATPSQLAGFLVALRAKGETVDEIVGFRDAILEAALPLPVDPNVLDIVGTGGDRFGTVNVSTMAAVVAAASGVPVVKHGNRAASSASGSSDVLSALGIDLTLTPEQVAETLARAGITFAFASAFHPGFRHAGPTRSELGVPTVFNFLGPLCNPARAEANAVGVAHLDRVPLITGVFRTRGATALVFRGDDGLDELTTTGHSRLWEVSRGDVHEHDLDPRDLGIRLAQIDDLLGGEPAHNASIVHRVFEGEQGAVRDIVLLNAAAGIVSFRLSQDATQVQRPILERLAEERTPRPPRSTAARHRRSSPTGSRSPAPSPERADVFRGDAVHPHDALTEIATLLERERSSRYKSKAFRAAADAIEGLSDEQLRDAASLRRRKGIGDSTFAVIQEALEGRVPTYLLDLRERAGVQRSSTLRGLLRGDLHSHSDWSDGLTSIDLMVDAARALGHEYLALTDHSPRLRVANGLSPERLRAQLEIVGGMSGGRIHAAVRHRGGHPRRRRRSTRSRSCWRSSTSWSPRRIPSCAWSTVR